MEVSDWDFSEFIKAQLKRKDDGEEESDAPVVHADIGFGDTP